MMSEIDKVQISLKCVLDTSDLTNTGKTQALKWVLREVEESVS
jgi:hypothetical protein